MSAAQCQGDPYAGLTRAKPEDVGICPERLDRLRRYVEDKVGHGHMAGMSIGLARHGKIVLTHAQGHQNVENDVPMTETTLCRLYSQSKALTAVALMTLFEEARFQLYEPLERYLPEFQGIEVIREVKNGKVATSPPKRPLTLYDLFLHMSGIAYPTNYPEEVGISRDVVMNLDQTMAEGMQRLAQFPLLFEPGERFKYGYAFDILGRVAEVITGQRLDAILQDRIFGPLGMLDTGFHIPPEKRARLADVYAPIKDGGMANATSQMPVPCDFFSENPKLLSGGAGVVSTMPDMMRVTMALMNKGALGSARILSPATVNYMMLNHMPGHLAPLPDYYPEDPVFGKVFSGLRMNLFFATVTDVPGRQSLDMEGSFTSGGLAGTYAFGDPSTGLAGVLMTQVVGTKEDARFVDQFKTLCYQSVVA